MTVETLLTTRAPAGLFSGTSMMSTNSQAPLDDPL
jgi:hypothetical protein